MSLSPNSPLMKYLPIVAGYFMADTINTQIDKVMPADLKANASYGKIIGGAEAGLGALLLFKGKKSILVATKHTMPELLIEIQKLYQGIWRIAERMEKTLSGMPLPIGLVPLCQTCRLK